jgi:hypothetical protein
LVAQALSPRLAASAAEIAIFFILIVLQGLLSPPNALQKPLDKAFRSRIDPLRSAHMKRFVR